MRPLIDSMILAMVLMIAVGVVSYRQSVKIKREQLHTVQSSLDEFDARLAIESALWQAEQPDTGNYPPQVHPEWFKDHVPNNPLVSSDRPWIDIAPPDDFHEHPPDPLITRPDQAAFWYNPNLGIVRARVPRQVSNRESLELYNRVNRLSLAALPTDDNPQRVPLAYQPPRDETTRHASPTRQTLADIQTRESTKPDDPEDESKPLSWQQPAEDASQSDETVSPDESMSHNRPSLLSR